MGRYSLSAALSAALLLVSLAAPARAETLTLACQITSAVDTRGDNVDVSMLPAKSQSFVIDLAVQTVNGKSVSDFAAESNTISWKTVLTAETGNIPIIITIDRVTGEMIMRHVDHADRWNMHCTAAQRQF